MNFNFSEEQELLRDTLASFIKRDYDFEARRGILESEAGWSRETWTAFADMGLLALPLPEEHGGLGGNAIDLFVAMEAIGRGLIVEPFLATVVLGAGLVARAGTESQQAQVLPAVASGECLLAYAHGEHAARYVLSHVDTRARADGDGWVIDGAKTVVLHGAQANKLIVSARTRGDAGDDDGLSLFLVDANAQGLHRSDYPTQDGSRAAEVVLKSVRLGADALMGELHQAWPHIVHAQERAIAAVCAEAIGLMDTLNQDTISYLQTRKQFGVAIGSFQALQHRMVDMLLATEQARSMAYLAAVKVETDEAAERAKAVAQAKAMIGQSGRTVGQGAVQLHGGMGVTLEVRAAHLFKRLTMINTQFGDADHHLGQLSDGLLAA